MRKYNQKGFSTLEMIIAMTMMILVLTAVILVTFGNQSVLSDSQTNTEALNIAQGLLEKAQADARKDFNLVNASSSWDGFYQTSVTVQQTDYFTKLVTASVLWTGDGNRPQSVSLSGLVTNFNNAVGGDTCSSVLLPDGNAWENPQISPPTGLYVGDLNSADPSAAISLDASLDTYNNGRLYAAISDAAASNSATLFIYGLADPKNPVLLNSADNVSGVKAGVSAVRVAGKYLYAAKNTGPGGGQLQIFDVSSDNLNQVGSNYKIPTSIVNGTGSQATGNSIFYKDGYVYLGLTTTASGPEFNIIDVHAPSSPQWIGGYQVSNDINAIYVKGSYAYLATPNGQELITLDVSDPANIKTGSPPWGYDAAGGSGNGKSLYLVGDSLYLGRTVGGTEFYIFDNKSPNISQLPILGFKNDIDDSINGLIVRDYLTFLLTNSQLEILKTDNPASISMYSAITLPAGGEGKTLDCEGNYLYAGFTSGSKAYLSVITPGL